jgi:N-formylglutamate amidohydrolase
VTERKDQDAPAEAIEIIRPSQWTSPFILASPHSGRRYAASFLEQSRLDLMTLRRSEDGYVDLLFDMAPALGAPLIKALFPRAYVDVNRSALELDPMVFSGRLPSNADTRSNRVLAGFGVIPRLAADGLEIYPRKIPYREADYRLQTFYHPYHQALSALIDEAVARFGCAIVLDCHSMPSQGPPNRPGQQTHVDFVLGDRYGSSCAPCLTSLTHNLLTEAGYRVSRNAPYAGGYVSQNYGKPGENVHALQLEINRRLYLDEQRISRTAGFAPLRRFLEEFVGELMKINLAGLQQRQAAE